MIEKMTTMIKCNRLFKKKKTNNYHTLFILGCIEVL